MPDHVLSVITDDAHNFNISCYGNQDAEKVLLFFPAMGVQARYYRIWARSMADNGFLCCIPDLRGHGSSNIRPKSGVDFGYHDILEQDYQSAINTVLDYAESDSIYLGGHSLGGQLSCMFAGTRHPDLDWLSGLLVIAACTIRHTGWSGYKGFAMRLVPYLFSMTAKILGYFPGNSFRFAGTEARQQMIDWAQSGIRGVYQPLGYEKILEPLMAQVRVPLLSISFEGDDYAPIGAVEHLISKMPACEIEKLHLSSPEYPDEILDHFLWARKQTDITTGIVSSRL